MKLWIPIVCCLLTVGCGGGTEELPHSLQAKYDSLSEADRIVVDAMEPEDRRIYLASIISLEERISRMNEP